MFFLFQKICVYAYACDSVYIYHMCASACRDQKRVMDSLEIELQAVVTYPMWVLGTQLCSSGGTEALIDTKLPL